MSMNAEQRQDLAERLAKMSYAKARKEIRRVDKAANLKIWRNSVNDNEVHTTYELPNEQVRVTLVEEAHYEDKQDRLKIKYFYVEARVDEFKRV